jgi:predicted transglutaminase-like cysteine proteinase
MSATRQLKTLGTLIIGLIGLVAPVAAADFSNPAFIQSTEYTSIPIGAAEFCQSRPAECAPSGHRVDAIALDQNSWGQLVAVNAAMNSSIVPITDRELYNVEEFWTYPNGFGDCEDIALAKRRELMGKGWPASALLMTVVRQANGEGHAVLLVRTDRGDFVLDNQSGSVSLWRDTPYTYLKRQSQANPAQWVDLVDDHAGTVTAAVR